jgi:hypothetical protein
MNLDIDTIKNVVIEDGIELCVTSYGGSCTNVLTDTLHECGIQTNTKLWGEVLSHLPGYVSLGIPIIYVYDNPIKSFMSTRRRGLNKFVHRKMNNNNKNVIYTHEKLIRNMITQFHSFTNVKRDDVLVLHSKELFNANVIDKISLFLSFHGIDKKISHKFPFIYKNPSHKHDDLTLGLAHLFNKYSNELKFINNYS